MNSRDEEQLHLDHFKSVLPFFPEGQIERHDPPDFIIRGSHNVAIEHTRIFQPGPPHGDSLQAQETHGQRIVDRAKALYGENAEPVLVSVRFLPRGKIRKGDIDRISVSIKSLVEESLTGTDDDIELRGTLENAGHFPIEVSLISVKRRFGNRWTCQNASGWSYEISAEELQKKIDCKESNLSSYRKECKEVWLLIVADFGRNSTSVDLDRTAEAHHYVTQFNHVFLFWDWAKRYVELQRS